MSKAMQLVGIILLGIFTLAIVYLMSDVRSTNELDYYLLQEVTEASMYDAVDYSYYRESGLLKVDRDMFLESFNRRFAESVTNNRDYNIKIIDFNETPPKVSVEVTSPTVASVKGEVALVTNKVSGIIETIYDDYVYSRGNYGLDNYDDEAPEITVSDPNNNVYTITMTDNYMLEKYAIVELGSNGINQFTDSVYSSINNWININGYVNTYTINKSIANGRNGFWVVAVDRGGLWTAVPITDINPLISNWAFNPSSEGTISATFKDDRGLVSYTVQPVKCNGTASVASNGKASCSGNWSTNGTANTVNINGATVSDDGYYTKTVNNIDVSTADYYAITVKDNKGNDSEQLIVQGNRRHEIQIDWTASEGKLTATITDTYGDLYGYKITNSATTPSSWETASNGSSIMINAISIDTSKTYYIHAKDNSNHTTKVEVRLERRETILANDVSNDQISSIQAINCSSYKRIEVTIKMNSMNTNATRCGSCVCDLYPTLVLSNNSQFSISQKLATYIKVECGGEYGYSRYGDGTFSCGPNSTKTECSGKSNQLITGVEKTLIFDISSCPIDSNVKFSFDVSGGSIGYGATITKIEGITR